MVAENKQIAKNTLYLYVRMLLIMLVSLYTSRVTLQVLGVSDFGINNVVGGIITMLAFVTTSISSGTSRFYAFEIGRGDLHTLNQYFKLSVTLFFFVGLVVLLLAETLGLWFVNTQMVIPAERIRAANWVYQCSIISFMLNMFLVPFQSMIIAFENMKIYAFAGIIEVILKLLVIYFLLVVNADKLILFAVLYLSISLVIFVLYVVYCLRKYPSCAYSFFFDKSMFKEFSSYSGWIIFGSLAGVIRGQGINIVLNLFFGPIVNAARGIAFQVERAVSLFVHNFYTAVRPQITKRYSAGNFKDMFDLVFSSSRYCYYLVFVLGIPILIQTEYILQLWLGEAPAMSVLFTRLVLIAAVVESLSYPLDTAVMSTGRIKAYQFITGGLLILNLPLSYLLLKLGYPPESTMYVAIAMALAAHIPRMLYAKKEAGLSLWAYTREVLWYISLVTVVAVLPLLFLYRKINFGGFGLFVVFSLLCVLWSLLVIYFIGIGKRERKQLAGFVLQKIRQK